MDGYSASNHVEAMLKMIYRKSCPRCGGDLELHGQTTVPTLRCVEGDYRVDARLAEFMVYALESGCYRKVS